MNKLALAALVLSACNQQPRQPGKMAETEGCNVVRFSAVGVEPVCAILCSSESPVRRAMFGVSCDWYGRRLALEVGPNGVGESGAGQSAHPQ